MTIMTFKYVPVINHLLHVPFFYIFRLE